MMYIRRSYWMTLSKRQNTDNIKRKKKIPFYRELAVEETMDFS